MKPKDLKYPFIDIEPTIIIKDRVWYIPEYLPSDIAFTFPGWNHLFGNQNPIQIEYCSGNGTWIASKAVENPNINWIAVELKFERVKKIWSKIKNLNLKNLFVICGEGYQVTQKYFPATSFEEVFINFPDPWPKRKHQKNRIIQSTFVSELTRCLKKNGSLTIVTDDIPFSRWITKIVSLHPSLKPWYGETEYITENPEYGTSYFEALWREKGKVIRYHKYKKSDEAYSQRAPQAIPSKT